MDENPLIPVVRALPLRARQAMYDAASRGPLQRHTWSGCVFHQAGLVLGKPVRNQWQAAKALGTDRPAVGRFIKVWDGLGGTDERCTALLRDALLRVGSPMEPAIPEPVPDAGLRRVAVPV